MAPSVVSLEPIHRWVPIAAARDRRFYDAMALVDAIRSGRDHEIQCRTGARVQ